MNKIANTDEKIILRSKKKIAPSFLGYIGLLLYLMLFICFVGFVISGICKNKTLCLIFIGIEILCGILIVFFDYFFTWYYSAELMLNNKSIIYKKTTVAPDNQNIVTYKINHITKLKKKKNNLIIYGDITIKAPYKKEKGINKCVIFDYQSTDKNIENLIEKLS